MKRRDVYHIRQQDSINPTLCFRNHDRDGLPCTVAYLDPDRAIMAHLRARIEQLLHPFKGRVRFHDNVLKICLDQNISINRIRSMLMRISFTSYRYNGNIVCWSKHDEHRVISYYRAAHLSKCKFSFKFYMNGKSILLQIAEREPTVITF